ncbi:metallophosphoesterase [Adhaeribacter arboris]|uniref:Metallophosphoesterase n=1 Tax=Adhaeribacter arboris TaxID=2072846 RepID=A0A2T2YLA4_9BACT|nr:metallophosphoesterase [Adhaeribacter arboris]PSR56287.1 metallophosphoesterase [Adhaeribacter arboris]
MSNRRQFLEKTIKGVTGLTLLPAVNTFAENSSAGLFTQKGKFKLRFAVASDGHYAQPKTESDVFYADLIKWLTKDHQQNHLDFVIVNGDLVHDRPDLLKTVKTKYLDTLPCSFYALPGNHDFADAAIWKSVFGYEDNYSFEKGDIGFVLANTATPKGEYVCPNNTFLKNALDAFKTKSIVFVVLHIAPHQWLPEDDKTFLNCPETLRLLHAYPNIKAVFHGHDHSLDNVRYTDKLPHFFDSHFGGNWGTAYKGYRIVEINQANQIYTYQVNASQNPTLNANKI